MLAVVIPYYKLKFLDETLLSLKNQSNKRFITYIGNDASPDCPEDLLREYRKNLQIVYKKFNENLGSVSLTRQWERCLEMVQDETWIMVLGDDDKLGSECVEEFYRNLEEIEREGIKV